MKKLLSGLIFCSFLISGAAFACDTTTSASDNNVFPYYGTVSDEDCADINKDFVCKSEQDDYVLAPFGF